MAVVRSRIAAGPAAAAALSKELTGVCVERRVAPGSFEQVDGPFAVWERTVRTLDGGNPTTDGRETSRIEETVRFRLAARGWSVLFIPLVRRSIKVRARQLAALDTLPEDEREAARLHTERQPWWAPPQRLDQRATRVLGVICTLSVITGYLGTVLTQTITFAADRFGSSNTEQSGTLAAVRVGVLGSLFIVAAADRRGRRRILLLSIVGSCVTTALGALAPNLAVLGLAQTVSRALSTVAGLLLAVVAAEEMPAGTRAFAVSVTTLTAALGAGMCVWLLPLADVNSDAWRVLYLAPLLGIPLVMSAGRSLPESRRFTRPHARAKIAGHGRRLILLGVVLFSAAMFAAPASQLQNQFLRDERGFSALQISLFTMLTVTPAGIGVVLGGWLADRHGRRLIGALGAGLGAILTLGEFFAHGWLMWLWAMAGTQAAAFSVPALGVYGPELFPTGLRAKANGILQVAAVAGSSVGLLVVGFIADRTGHLSSGMSVVLVGPLLVALLVWVAFPETARRELEDINPEDDLALSVEDLRGLPVEPNQ